MKTVLWYHISISWWFIYFTHIFFFTSYISLYDHFYKLLLLLTAEENLEQHGGIFLRVCCFNRATNKCHHCVQIIVIQHSTHFMLPNTQRTLFQWYVIKTPTLKCPKEVGGHKETLIKRIKDTKSCTILVWNGKRGSSLFMLRQRRVIQAESQHKTKLLQSNGIIALLKS